MPLSIHATHQDSSITLTSRSGPNNLAVVSLAGPVLFEAIALGRQSTDFFESEEPTGQVLRYSDGNTQVLTPHSLISATRVLSEFRYVSEELEAAVQESFQPFFKQMNVRFNPDNQRLLLSLKRTTFFDQIVVSQRN